MESEKEKGMSIFLDVFRRADKKDDGKISWGEFVSFFADGVMGKEELKALFNEIDTHNTNFIDPEELCNYFSKHLGDFKDIYSQVEELNKKVSTALLSTSQTYPQSSRNKKFITRFLLGEVLNQLSALQHPLESASDALDEQARNERTDIVPIQVEEVKKPAEGTIIPGRVVRRARRQTSSQTSIPLEDGGMDGVLTNSKYALDNQVDRLASLLDRLENRVNFDGMVDEEVEVTSDKQLLLLQRHMSIAEGKLDDFKACLRTYIEATNSSPGCLSVNVRSFTGSNRFDMYEVWKSEEQEKSHSQSDAGQLFKQSSEKTLAGPVQLRSVTFPASWWKRDY